MHMQFKPLPEVQEARARAATQVMRGSVNEADQEHAGKAPLDDEEPPPAPLFTSETVAPPQ
jgi:hypothetical protein